MAGRIPESFIEELLSRTDIVDVIERRVPLKKVGHEYQARCPFHDEKTPSFTVSPAKQFYHCFGCGAHGSAIGFLMQFEGLEFRDAIEDLARGAGLQVPATGAAGAARQDRSGLYAVLEQAARWYQERLKGHEPAVAYLKGRGLTGEICRDFDIGYAPAGWDGLLTELGGDEAGLKLLRRAGLLSEGRHSSYDKFRDRIMFPIHDRRGRVIAFGGRAIGDDGPKYLNSPETELFHKGRELYGLYLARRGSGRLNEVIVVEGYMDVVALAQFGIGNAVATLGTATTPEQAALLFRATDTVIYCFDGDAAGRKAAWKALLATLPKVQEGKQARFLFLPEGEDPDSLVRREGADAFRGLIGDAQPLSEFFFERLGAEVDLDSIDGRARLVQLALPHLGKLPPGVFRDMMHERLETLARHRLNPAALGAEVSAPRSGGGSGRGSGRGLGRGSGSGPARATGRRVAGSHRTPIRLALAHLAQNPAFAQLAGDLAELRELDLPGRDLLCELVDFCRDRPNLTSAQLVETWRGHPAHEHLVKLVTWRLPGDADSQSLEFQDALTHLRLRQAQEELSRLPRIIDQDAEQKQTYRVLQARIQRLKQDLRGQDDLIR